MLSGGPKRHTGVSIPSCVCYVVILRFVRLDVVSVLCNIYIVVIEKAAKPVSIVHRKNNIINVEICTINILIGYSSEPITLINSEIQL